MFLSHSVCVSLSFCSGESGSGKTEACKHIVRHLAVRSSPKGFSLEPRMKHVSVGYSTQTEHLALVVLKRFILLEDNGS